ncbi:MAG: SMC-Scp complex subunit ScpB, partial [Thermodesulfovibrionia bacterium]|nr:SMC-Scp complex subunit ScpB [Thermodesulfovibrionia bacterium]
ITKAEIEAIRGVNSDGVVKTLLERRLVKILGRKEAPGRPLMYGTTKEFLQQFGLRDLSELPTLKEFREVVDAAEPLLTEEHPGGLLDSKVGNTFYQPEVTDTIPKNQNDEPLHPE